MHTSPELVALARSGDRAALDRLVRNTQDPLFHFLSRELASATDAEDALQETWRQAILSLPALRDPAAFRGWIHRIALRTARDLAVSRRSRRHLEGNASRNESVEVSAMAGAERLETAERVRAAVAALEPGLRTAVRLRYEQGLSYEEIAVATESPSGTVGKRLHTAHERLREALAGVGVMLALAALERELQAAERVAAPESAKRRLAQLVRERKPGPARAGKKRFPAAAAVAVLMVLGILVLWKSGGRGGAANEVPTGGPAVVHRTGAPPAGVSPGSKAEVATSSGQASAPVGVAAFAPGTGRVTGRVRDVASGSPIVGARVQLRPVGKTDGRTAVYGTTDAAGNFAIEALPGAWYIDAWSDDYPAFSVRDFVEDIVIRGRTEAKPEGPVENDPLYVGVTAAGSSHRDLDLVAGKHLGGRVVDARGFPVAGATVDPVFITVHGKIGFAGCECAPSGVPLKCVTGADGRFTLPAVWPTGNLTVKVSCHGFKETDSTLAVADALGDLILTIEAAAAFAGTVLDEFGRPIPGVLVFAGSGDPTVGGGFLMPLQKGADESGHFSDPGARSPNVVLAWAPGYGIATADMRTGDASRLDLRLPVANGRIRGVVRDDAGLVVAGARVSVVLVGAPFGSRAVCIPLAGSYSGTNGALMAYLSKSLPGPEATTGVDGAFELDGIPAGAGTFVTLRVEAPGFKPKDLRVPDGKSADVVLDPPAK
jgi:RNA polymerase sigma-70 factor (ECF subfamily)